MFSPENSILLVIDIQGKLASSMFKSNELFANAATLIHATHLLETPTLVTEQVPEKLGVTIPEISQLLNQQQPITKSSFSCCGENIFMKELELLNRKQIIISGIEAHVCVYQTVCDLLSKGYEVQVVGDAVSSRTEMNKNFALDQIRVCGGGITSTEMIICELLKSSEHPNFRKISHLIK